ncbi:GFA family protein [uncultured Aquitalea sp.]|uniref:GFA family protein n=1 Tax=uncultured Aquitalea sp. TaxID=540272 RepID=UPI0025CC00BB|nr:GFA family protein [uncultured Aquitalea sp.]
MSQYHVRCECGGVSLTIHGQPLRVSVCHCLACRRRTGSVMSVQARFLAADLQLQGETREYTRLADSGNAIRQLFCSRCAGIICYYNSALPTLAIVPAGMLAEALPPPDVSVYECRKAGWLSLCGDMQHLD